MFGTCWYPFIATAGSFVLDLLADQLAISVFDWSELPTLLESYLARPGRIREMQKGIAEKYQVWKLSLAERIVHLADPANPRPSRTRCDIEKIPRALHHDFSTQLANVWSHDVVSPWLGVPESHACGPYCTPSSGSHGSSQDGGPAWGLGDVGLPCASEQCAVPLYQPLNCYEIS